MAHFGARPSPRLGPFWLRRIVRIFPAYWVYVSVRPCRSSCSAFLTANSVVDYLTYYGLLHN